MRDLVNNIQPILGNQFTNGEYVVFVGGSVVQPLLKNAGRAATMANLRLAAVASEVAFQEYRRELMLTLSMAEAAYWNLYLAQRQIEAVTRSARLAETLLRDNEARWRVGRGSEMEVLEARAGLAARLSKLAEARQNRLTAIDRLLALFSEPVSDRAPDLVAVDMPPQPQPPAGFDPH